MFIDKTPRKNQRQDASSIENRGGVSMRRYKKLLSDAGFSCHQHLTGEPIEIDHQECVFDKSLRSARYALEKKISEDKNFSLHHLSNERVSHGVKKLQEFLYAY